MKYLILLLSINTCMADWVKEPDYLYNRPCAKVTQVVFIYHGMTTSAKDLSSIEDLGEGLNRYVNFLLKKCSLVVMPLAGRYLIHGESIQVWDMTNQLTYGVAVANQIELIMLAKSLTNAPIYLVGGSAGAVMAYRIANTLAELDIDIDGLVLLDGVNPYHMNIYNFRNKEVLRSFKGHNLVTSSYVGSPNLDVDILVLLSKEDPIIPEKYKMSFVHSLICTYGSVEYGIYGSNHNIGEVGIDHLIQWSKERL